MPQPDDPPDLGLPQSVFNTLKTYSYDSTAKAFKSGLTLYFLYAEKLASPDQVQWNYCTTTQGAANPKGLVPQLTYDIIAGGTYNTNGTVSYSGTAYRFRLAVDTSGKQIAEAHAV